LASLLVSASAGVGEALEPLALRWTALPDRSPEVARLRTSWGAAALAAWISGGRLDESLAEDLIRLRSEDLGALEDWTFDEARLAMDLDVALGRGLDAWRAAAGRASDALSGHDQRVALRWARIDDLRELGSPEESFQELRTAVAGLAWREFRYRREFDEAEWRGGLWASLCEAATDIAQVERARAAFARRTVGGDPGALELLARIDAHLAALKSAQPAAAPETPPDDPSGENP
jgi:hypothetical protein